MTQLLSLREYHVMLGLKGWVLTFVALVTCSKSLLPRDYPNPLSSEGIKFRMSGPPGTSFRVLREQESRT